MKKSLFTIPAAIFLLFVGCMNDISFESANFLAEEGNFQTAVSHYQKFAARNSDNRLAPSALFNAASILHTEIKDNKAAIETFTKLANQFPNTKWAAESYRRLMEIALDSEDHMKAVEYCGLGIKHASAEGGIMPPAWFQQMAESSTNSANMIDDFDAKIRAYIQLVEYLPHGRLRAATMLQLAEAFESVGKMEEASTTLRELMETYPGSDATTTAMTTKKEIAGADFNWKALNLTIESRNKFIDGDYKGAIKKADEVIKNYPESGFAEATEFGKIVAEVHLTRDFETGMDNMRDYLDKFPNAVPKDEAELRLENWGEILGFLDTVEEDPKNYSVHSRLGNRLMRLNMNQMAEKHLLIASKSPDANNVYMSLGQLYSNLGDTKKAEQYFTKYLDKNPDNGNAFNNLGYTMLGQGNLSGALKCFERYVEIEPENANSHDSYGEGLMRSGKLEDSIREYSKAIEIDPNFTNSIFMLAEVYKLNNDNNNALKYYKMFLEKVSIGNFSETAQANIDSLSAL